MNRTIAAAACLTIAAATHAHAQAAQKSSGNAVASSGIVSVYNYAKTYLIMTAEEVPEDKYSFQPTKDVRTVGAMLAHIADANNYFCAVIAGKPAKYEAVAEKLQAKPEIVAALKQSFEACDAAQAGVTDADLSKQVEVFGNRVPLSAAMTMNATHEWEHYGNLVTYMRINGMVPPSSRQ